MQLVTVGKDFFAKCKQYGTDRELLYDKQGRPNISKRVPKDQYFPLPPNASTQPGKRHGVHYIKLFPMDRKYVHP